MLCKCMKFMSEYNKNGVVLRYAKNLILASGRK